MSELSATLGRIAGFISLAGFVPYLVDTLRGRTRPNRATWWIWTLVGGGLFLSYRTAGGGESLWVPLSFVVGPLVTAVVSLRYGEGGWSRLDRLCLGGALASLCLWGLWGSAVAALWLNIVIDAFGAVPTIVKAWRDPDSEHLLAWLLFLCGNGLNLLALPHLLPAVAAYPVYLFALAASVVACILRGRFARRYIFR